MASLLIKEGKMNMGELTSFLLYCLHLHTQATIAANCYNEVLSAYGPCLRIVEILDRKPLINISGGKCPDKTIGKIEIRDLSFNYSNKFNVLKNITFEIN